MRWWRSAATLTTQRRDPTRKCLRWKVRPDGRFIGVMECHDQRKRMLLFATAIRKGLRSKQGFVLGRIPKSVSLSMRSQRTTVGHNETLNKLSRTQSLPRTQAKPRPRTHSVFLNTRVCCTFVLRLRMVRVFVCAVSCLLRSRGKGRAVSSEARRRGVSSHDRFAEAKHRVEDTVFPPVVPRGHSRWTDPERC